MSSRGQAQAQTHPVAVSPERSRFVQVDLTKPAAEVTLGAAVLAELLRGAEVLQSLSR